MAARKKTVRQATKPITQTPAAAALDEVPPIEPSGTAVAAITSEAPLLDTDPFAVVVATETKQLAAGDSLLSPETPATELRMYTYWVGTFENCPAPFLTCGGICFPKGEILLTENPASKTKKLQHPVIGTLQEMSLAVVQSVITHLPLRVVRTARHADSTGKTVGYGVRIPKQSEIDERVAAGRSPGHYVADEKDEPMAKWVYCILCPDQKNPERGHTYPPPVSETGIQWPDKSVSR